MQAGRLIASELNALNREMHNFADGMQTADWLRRGIPDTNLAAFDFWHIPRVIDSTVNLGLRGTAEVIASEPWASKAWARPGIGTGYSRAEADALAAEVVPAEVLATRTHCVRRSISGCAPSLTTSWMPRPYCWTGCGRRLRTTRRPSSRRRRRSKVSRRGSCSRLLVSRMDGGTSRRCGWCSRRAATRAEPGGPPASMRAEMAPPAASAQTGRLAERLLWVGGTVFAVGILVFLAARSVNGGFAGLLLSTLLSALVVSAALATVTGLWRESRQMLPRHAALGGCLTGVALCATGGVVFCFGSQLLIGALFGGVAAFVNNRQGWIQWTAQIESNPASALVSPPIFAGSRAPLFTVSSPAARAVAVPLAIALLLAGIVFGGLGAGRALEGAAVAGDMGCTAPCGMQRGLWVQVVPDAQGHLLSLATAGLVEIRLSFHDDAPGERDVIRNDFTLSGPDPKLAYAASLERPECGAWKLRIQLDDTDKLAMLCFSIPGAADVDLAQLQINWGSVVIPLGAVDWNFSLFATA